jgi:endonuclease/exonuclease/phosphatase family metal-dependent hydrolase
MLNEITMTKRSGDLNRSAPWRISRRKPCEEKSGAGRAWERAGGLKARNRMLRAVRQIPPFRVVYLTVKKNQKNFHLFLKNNWRKKWRQKHLKEK